MDQAGNAADQHFLGRAEHSCERCWKGVALGVQYGTLQTTVHMKWSACPYERRNMGGVVEG